MRNRIFSKLIILIATFSTLPSCVTIYNYDLSLGGLGSLPSTKAFIEKHLPHSIDAYKGEEDPENNITEIEVSKTYFAK